MPVSQLSPFANKRPMVVLPTPRVPLNKYAWCKRFCAKAFSKAVKTWDCPTTSLNRVGRHLRAKAR
ncbi:Uncharacterised protein [Vibrio cholerae]|nr:Uncharacterised protein [Vibrio cholerae]CSA78746.1 Uncharacterised protein [Vibrio cholerae]CSC30581.1 Uncharacterised protein [Vibrio cholerae]CSI23995.1 Uncharacterised protein [Vibrio cholerae]